MTPEEHRKNNYDLCRSIDLTSLGVALDRLIVAGLPASMAHQYRLAASALLTLLRSENDRLALARPAPITPEDRR